MNFRELDELVDAHQSVTTMVWVDGERVHTNLSKGVDRPWRVYSITKSIVSLVTGIAQDEGLDQPGRSGFAISARMGN
jgi:CubicO group peptidase (beta-lactamase class C family)